MKGDLLQKAKGLVESLSAGVKQLVTLHETLATLAKEGGRSREDILQLQKIVERHIVKLDEMDRRIGERFAALDKRQDEIDKRLAVQIELAVRTELDRRIATKGMGGPER